MSHDERMSDAWRAGKHHGACGLPPKLPESTVAALTRAMAGDAPPEPGFAWAFGQGDYTRGYEVGYSNRFWAHAPQAGYRLPAGEREKLSAQLRSEIATLPWNVKS